MSLLQKFVGLKYNTNNTDLHEVQHDKWVEECQQDKDHWFRYDALWVSAYLCLTYLHTYVTTTMLDGSAEIEVVSAEIRQHSIKDFDAVTKNIFWQLVFMNCIMHNVVYTRGMQLLNRSGYSAIRSSLTRSLTGPSTITGRVYFTDALNTQCNSYYNKQLPPIPFCSKLLQRAENVIHRHIIIIIIIIL